MSRFRPPLDKPTPPVLSSRAEDSASTGVSVLSPDLATVVPEEPAAPAAPAYRLPASKALPIGMLGVYLFFLSSDTHEFLGAFGHISLPLVAGFYGLVCLFYVGSGNLGRFFRSPFAFPWMAMLVWWWMASGVGFYPGRSIRFILTYSWRIHLLPLIICGIALDVPGIRKVLRATGFGLPVVLLICVFKGQTEFGRFFIPRTSLANGNDLALHILLFGCLSIILLTGKMSKMLLIGMLPVAVYFVLKTASRANMLTMILLVIFGFFLLPARQKMIIAILGLFLPILLVPLLPHETTARLMSIFRPAEAGSADAELDANAVASTNARIELQKHAIEITGQHILFGIGPQNFEDAVDEMVRAETGEKSGWQVAHNSYLEASAETGIPGFIFYTWSIILCLKLNLTAFRRARNQPDEKLMFLMSLTLFAASCVYAIGILFCTILYDFQLAMLVGLTAATWLATADREAAARAA